MATATKPPKGKRGAAVGVPPAEIDPGPSQAAQDLAKRLADFGFEVPVALIHQWDATTFTTVARTVEHWMDEFATAMTDRAVPEADRTIVPPLLKNFEVVDETLTRFAETHARSVAEKIGDKPEAVNPYPPETSIGKIWADTFLKAVGAKSGDETKSADSETPAAGPESTAANPEAKPAEPVATAPAATPPTPAAAPSNHATAAELNARRAEESRLKRINQQKLAIEGAQIELEEAARHETELEEEVKSLKADLKEKKAAFDNASEQVRAASRKLQRAREGWFDPNVLPFSQGPQNHPDLSVPDVDIGGESATSESAPNLEPQKPAVDEGAFVSLDHLVKKDLQEFIPGTNDDIGISQKQADILKNKVGGTGSVGDLEKFMRDHGEWWHKQIDGIGKETRGKIEDALAVVRRKFPIPDPDEPAPEPEAAPAAAASDPEPVETIPALTDSEAVARLQKLMARCKDVAETCERDEGIQFLTSVGDQAASMRTNILEHKNCTPDQARAIVNWEAGVEGWADEPAAESDDGDEEEVDFGDGLASGEAEEEIDIDDEDDGEDGDEEDLEGDYDE